MRYTIINQCLSKTDRRLSQIFPRLTKLHKSPYIFKMDFGLKELPKKPGVLIVRGARQYGKNTWLEQEVVKTFGAGSAFYLNGMIFYQPKN